MRAYVVVDVETTGTRPLKNDIIEIGAAYIEEGKMTKKFSSLVKPTESISEYIESITGINEEMVKDAPTIEEIFPKFAAFCEDVPLVGHHLTVFDYRILKVKATRLGIDFQKEAVDTLTIARQCLDHLPSRRLKDLCDYYKIELSKAHRAFHDAYATYQLFECLKKDFKMQKPQLFVPERMTWEVPRFEPMTAKQKKYLRYLCQHHQLPLTVDMDQLSKSEASRKVDQIIREYGKP